MDSDKAILLGMGTILFGLFLVNSYAWFNIFSTVNMITPAVELTKEQAFTLDVHGLVAQYSLAAVFAMYVVILNYTLLVPFIERVLKRYKIFVETDDGSSTDGT